MNTMISTIRNNKGLSLLEVIVAMAIFGAPRSFPDGSEHTITATARKIEAGAASFPAAILSRGPVGTKGNLVVDGRNHDRDGNLLGSGVLAISSRSTYAQGGNSRVAGTTDAGINYDPTKSDPGLGAVTEQYATDWGDPSTPEQALGISTANGLKIVAQSGMNGSQYAADPSGLSFPLSGVTYVEIDGDDDWEAIDFGASSGILVVHNASTDAVIKNLNTGSFKGIIIADDCIHIHTDIIGCVINLTTNPSEGNVIGNGSGDVLFSSEAIADAISMLDSFLDIVSWKEGF